MRYVKGLYNEKKNFLKEKSWYNQRFDGCPYFIGVIAEAELADEERKGPEGVHSVRVAWFENHRCDWYIVVDDLEKTTQAYIKFAKEGNGHTKQLMNKWEKDELEFYKRCLEIRQMDLGKLSDKELDKLLKNFMALYQRKVTGSSIIDGFALGSDEIIAKMVHDLLGKKGLDDRYSEIFSQLTGPVHLSFINEAEISLYRVANKIIAIPELVEFIVTNKVDKIIEELSEYPGISQALDEHEKNYFWSKNNYVADNVLDKKFFVKEIKQMFMDNVSPSEKILKISSTPERNRKSKEKLFKELEIDNHLKELLHYSEDFTHWQDERKKSTFWATHYFTILLTEVSKRLNCTVNELKYITPFEMSRIFEDGLPPDIKERTKKVAFVWIGDKCEAITGKQIDELKKVILGEEDLSQIVEVKGLTASLGYAKGRVRLVMSSTEIDKVEEGDILVAIMTRPDYVAGMKKAAAIVTEEGGVTSHAAIVSRELGIPAIIGTKNATRVFKDGDIVEVIAEKGIVRKV